MQDPALLPKMQQKAEQEYPQPFCREPAQAADLVLEYRQQGQNGVVELSRVGADDRGTGAFQCPPEAGAEPVLGHDLPRNAPIDNAEQIELIAELSGLSQLVPAVQPFQIGRQKRADVARVVAKRFLPKPGCPIGQVCE
jgi:hypothetical protein